jgi:UDP-N-acetylmuramoylalanine--D-glutamate ligase
VNADDPVVMAKSRETRARVIAFAPSGHVDEGFVAAGDWIVKRTTTGDRQLVPVSAVELTGAHMLHNAVAAVAVSAIAGIEPAAMVDALRGFHGLPHVMEPVAAIGGVRFINDSKATNVEAARRSIESFERGVVAIIGGRYKGGDFGELREPLRLRGRAVVAIGEAASRVREALGATLPVIDAASMADAVARGFEAAKPDGVVVLAPACSSFDWFEDYAARGEAFKAAVKELTARV